MFLFTQLLPAHFSSSEPFHELRHLTWFLSSLTLQLSLVSDRYARTTPHFLTHLKSRAIIMAELAGYHTDRITARASCAPSQDADIYT
jgi:hypothetical protein